MTSTIFSAPQPVSPHLAARPNPPDDSSLIQSVASILGNLFTFLITLLPSIALPLILSIYIDNTAPMPNSCLNEADTSLCVVETAGGVLSPSPSGSLQARKYPDNNKLWQKLRLWN